MLFLSLYTLLENRYFIKQILGKGGMGAVYLAEDRRLGDRAVAIKEIILQFTGEEDKEKALVQFRTEATMLAKLDHRNLPKVIDYFEYNGKEYLVMEYINGKTLKEYIDEKTSPCTEEEVINWAVEICSALDYLHSQNPPVVFRDLKPQNIMINNSGQLKLIDFGIAKIFTPSEETNTIIHARGTMGFCPPEQCSIKGNTDPRCDIFSLGATIHYLLTNRNPSTLPFVFPPLRELIPAGSEDMEKILIKALQLDCDDRYQNIKEFMNDLNKIISRKKKEGTMEGWIGKWWWVLAISTASYCAGLIGLRSLLHYMKPFLSYLFKPLSFLILFIYLFIPIGILIFYLHKDKSVRGEEHDR
ncbi:MAG: serine/threonine-protein kinase [Candidatus Eremiobacterota bacterium]